MSPILFYFFQLVTSIIIITKKIVESIVTVWKIYTFIDYNVNVITAKFKTIIFTRFLTIFLIGLTPVAHLNKENN
jgi:hypothetical protein